MQTQNTKSSKEKVAQKFALRVPPAVRAEWETAVREADEALSKKPIDRKLAFIKKHSVASTSGAVKVSNKLRSLSSSNGNFVNDLDDLESQNSPIDLGNGSPNKKFSVCVIFFSYKL